MQGTCSFCKCQVGHHVGHALTAMRVRKVLQLYCHHLRHVSKRNALSISAFRIDGGIDIEVPASSGRIPYHTPVKNFEKYTQFVKDHADRLGGDSCELMPCTLTQNMYALCVAMVSAIKKDMPSLHSDLGCETIDRPHGLRRAGSQSHYDSSVPGEWGISAQ